MLDRLSQCFVFHIMNLDGTAIVRQTCCQISLYHMSLCIFEDGFPNLLLGLDKCFRKLFIIMLMVIEFKV